MGEKWFSLVLRTKRGRVTSNWTLMRMRGKQPNRQSRAAGRRGEDPIRFTKLLAHNPSSRQIVKDSKGIFSFRR
jgi:hypothetical protein